MTNLDQIKLIQQNSQKSKPLTRYKLNKATHAPLTINLITITKRNNNKPLQLFPDVTYSTNDPTIIKTLQNYTIKPRYTEDLKQSLETHHIPYKIEYCQTCKGKVKKLATAQSK